MFVFHHYIHIDTICIKKNYKADIYIHGYTSIHTKASLLNLYYLPYLFTSKLNFIQFDYTVDLVVTVVATPLPIALRVVGSNPT